MKTFIFDYPFLLISINSIVLEMELSFQKNLKLFIPFQKLTAVHRKSGMHFAAFYARTIDIVF